MRQITGKDRAVVKPERHTVVGVPGGAQDLTRDADASEHWAALGKGDRDIAVHRDSDVAILRLCPGFHDRDRADLRFHHQERHAGLFELLGPASVI
jgi:hypothetical protein